MRTTPYTASEIKNLSAPTTAGDSGVFDLAQHMMKPAKNNVADTTTTTQSTTTDTSNQTEPNNPNKQTGASATFEDGKPADAFEEFKDGVGNMLEEADVQTIASILVQIGNVGRQFILPNMYETLMYPGTEKTDIRETMKKYYENLKANKDPEDGFNNYDKYLYAKWPKLRAAIENVSYTQTEIDKLAGMIARRIKDMTIAVWLVKYDWALYIVFLELVHGKNIIDQKGTDFFMSKFKPAKEAAPVV